MVAHYGTWESWGSAITNTRMVLGMTQEGFAHSIGITQGALSQLESGATTRPRSSTLDAIRRVHGWLIYDEGGTIITRREDSPAFSVRDARGEGKADAHVMPVLTLDTVGVPPRVLDRGESFDALRYFADTVLVRVHGGGMAEWGVSDGDRLIVCRGEEPRTGALVLLRRGNPAPRLVDYKVVL